MLFQKRKLLFRTVLILWLQEKQGLKIQSYQKYEFLMHSFLMSRLGIVWMKDLKEDHIYRFFEELEKEGVSISTRKILFYIIRSSLIFAHANKLCHDYHFSKVKFSSRKNPVHVFSKKEQSFIEQELKRNINIRKVCLLLCFYTGLRIGEVCGLKWSDIDFIHCSISVKRTIQRIRNVNTSGSKTILIESTPKSITSMRTIPVPNFVMSELKVFQSSKDYFLLSGSLKAYDPRQLESCYERVLRKCQIPYSNFHTIRHTFATRAIESKMDVKTLSELLGHASVEITLERYVHPSYDLKRKSIDNLVKYMNVTCNF